MITSDDEQFVLINYKRFSRSEHVCSAFERPIFNKFGAPSPKNDRFCSQSKCHLPQWQRGFTKVKWSRSGYWCWCYGNLKWSLSLSLSLLKAMKSAMMTKGSKKYKLSHMWKTTCVLGGSCQSALHMILKQLSCVTRSFLIMRSSNDVDALCFSQQEKVWQCRALFGTEGVFFLEQRSFLEQLWKAALANNLRRLYTSEQNTTVDWRRQKYAFSSEVKQITQIAEAFQ